jgi:acetoin utilization deacetylase AcuC-like enzyme
VVTPQGVALVSLERVHTPRYLHFLRTAWSALHDGHAGQDLLPAVWPARGASIEAEPEDFLARLGLFAQDACTPIGPNTWLAAKTGADCAINAAHALRVGERASFALTRPGGQHARLEAFGGGCFLNNAALAAQHLLDDGLARVAILDLARHHGQGTQDIFYARSDVLVVSLHLDPRHAYPFYAGHAGEQGAGAGLGATMNLPLAPDCGSAAWFAALETGCVKLAMFRPEALVVSLGGLAPGFGLQGGDCLRIGERLAHLDLPTAFMFEGAGASAAIVNILEGFETAA